MAGYTLGMASLRIKSPKITQNNLESLATQFGGPFILPQTLMYYDVPYSIIIYQIDSCSSFYLHTTLSVFVCSIHTSSTRTSRGRKFRVYKKKHKPIRTSKPIGKKIMHCRATKFLGMCDEGNAQPAAAHAPHSNEIH